MRLREAILGPEAQAAPAHDDGHVYVPDVCGGQWWGFAHAWADVIHDQGCSKCGAEAIDFVRAMHDAVNWKLGKPLQQPKALRRIAGWMALAADTVGGMEHPNLVQESQPRLIPEAPEEPKPNPGDVSIVEAFKFDTKLTRVETDVPRIQFNGPAGIARHSEGLMSSDRERLLVYYFDQKNRIIGIQEVTVGARSASMVPLDVIARAAILSNSSSIAFVHNHPSGDPRPSDADLRITKQAKAALEPFDVRILDHVIVGENGAYHSIASSDRSLVSEDSPTYFAAMRQDVIRISGNCSHDGPCHIKVTATDSVRKDVENPDNLKSAVDAASRELQAKRSRAASPKTFALGVNGLTRYEFVHQIRDAADLVISNDPYTFEVNPDYPADLQPRDRNRLGLRNQVERIAADINPDALIEDFRVLDRGTPIIGDDGIVEGGNGRTMALIRAALDFPKSWSKYQAALAERIPEFGLSKSDLADKQFPILVRVRLTDVDRASFAAETNSQAGISSSSLEDAQNDARHIDVNMLRLLDVGESASLHDALRSTRNAPFVQRFLSKLPEQQRAEYIDSDGTINQDGIRRMVMATFLAAFPGQSGVRFAEISFESIDEQVRNVVNAVGRSLGNLATAEQLVAAGERDADLAIGHDIAATVDVFARIKATGGLTVEKYLAQQQLTDRELSPFQEKILAWMDENSRSAKRMALTLNSYGERVISQPPPNQASLMGTRGGVTKEQLWEQSANQIGLFGNLEIADSADHMTADAIELDITENPVERTLSGVEADPKSLITFAQPDKKHSVTLGCVPEHFDRKANFCNGPAIVAAIHHPKREQNKLTAEAKRRGMAIEGNVTRNQAAEKDARAMILANLER